jgi:hypothetical protein
MGFIASILGGGAPPAPPPPAPLPPVPTGPSEAEIQRTIADSEKARRRRAVGSSRKENVKTSPLGLASDAGESSPTTTLLGG